MTEYRIFRPHDGRIPFREEDESIESLESDTLITIGSDTLIESDE